MAEATGSERGMVTIKFGTGYDAPWLTLPEEDAREKLIDWFGWDRVSVADYTGADVIVQASLEASAKFTAAKSLGGKPLSAAAVKRAKTAENKAAKAEAAEPHGADAWAAAEGGGEVAADVVSEDYTDPLIKALEEAPDIAELGAIYRLNKAAFTRDDVKEAFQAAKERLKK